MNTDELRRLTEQAKALPWAECGIPNVLLDGCARCDLIAAASPDVILSLLDERDRLVRLHQVTEKQGMGWADRALAAESRVAALEEALRRVVGDCDPLGTDPGYNEARALLQDKDKVTP